MEALEASKGSAVPIAESKMSASQLQEEETEDVTEKGEEVKEQRPETR
jgi:hypothetical protein